VTTVLITLENLKKPWQILNWRMVPW